MSESEKDQKRTVETSQNIPSETSEEIDSECLPDDNPPLPTDEPLRDGFDLPDPPEEPLQSDCCGTGCVPCVLDIYQEEMEKWLKLKSMTPQERAEWRRQQRLKQKEVVTKTALSLSQYKTFTITEIEKLTRNTLVFTFSLPTDCTLGLKVGQHVILR